MRLTKSAWVALGKVLAVAHPSIEGRDSAVALDDIEQEPVLGCNRTCGKYSALQ
jgi:hypothetical protein